MKCSICRQDGHNKRTCKFHTNNSDSLKVKKNDLNSSKIILKPNISKVKDDEIKDICTMFASKLEIKDDEIKDICTMFASKLEIKDDEIKNISNSSTSKESNNEEKKDIKKSLSVIKKRMELKTEDTGKIFEMAICLAYGIEYNGKYKYSMEIPQILQRRLSKLTELFPMCYHSANKGSRYDYTCLTDETKHLSAKTTKKGVGKVAPQVVGQSQPSKFCGIIGIEYTTTSDLKKYIQTEILKILPILVNYTFDCPNIYYNQEKNTIRYITFHTPIEWDKYEFKWTRNWNEWSNSSTLKIVHNNNEIALLEFQFHTKSRTNMAIRWCYENFLDIFKNNLNIINI
jgi:hypothetical protein